MWAGVPLAGDPFWSNQAEVVTDTPATHCACHECRLLLLLLLLLLCVQASR
jgi:hypothetical protein